MQKDPKKTLSDFLIFDLGTTNCFIANSLLSPLLHVKIHALVGNQRPSYDDVIDSVELMAITTSIAPISMLM